MSWPVHLGDDGHHRVPTTFLDLLAVWPGEEYILAFNRGTTTELIMPAGGIPELAAAIAEAPDDG